MNAEYGASGRGTARLLARPRLGARGSREGAPVLVAPDKFKGTLSASEVAAAIADGLREAGIGALDRVPVADGGEGTAEALLRARGGRFSTASVQDPLGREVEGRFALLDSPDAPLAVVEMAEASGLWRLSAAEYAAEEASSRGTGELIAAAISAGAREVIVAVGGSAGSDGGRGALEALGARFGGDDADLSGLQGTLQGVRLTVACDVEAPLCGPEGAAEVFAPQKGADPDAVRRLASRLEDWAALARGSTGRDPAQRAGAGAGGGLAAGLWAFAGAEIRSGAELVLEAIGFDRRLQPARWVLTGEGRLDDQTLRGKAVGAIASRCRRAGIPCTAIVGRNAIDPDGLDRLGIEVVEAAPGEIAEAGDIASAAAAAGRALSAG